MATSLRVLFQADKATLHITHYTLHIAHCITICNLQMLIFAIELNVLQSVWLELHLHMLYEEQYSNVNRCRCLVTD